MQRQQRIRGIWLLTGTLCVCTLGLGSGADRPVWHLAPRLVQGQELHYVGTVQEQSAALGVQFSKKYLLDVRALVIENKNDATEVAFLTRLTQTPAQAERGDDLEGVSLRLDLGLVNPAGRISGDGGISPSAAIDGPTTWETGFLTEAPLAGVAINQSWEVLEAGRPPRTYQAVGVEAIGNTTCVKIVANQQSDEWDQARADRAAWKRVDTLWVIPRLGIAQRVERTLERRDPARKEAAYKLTAAFDLANSIRYDGATFEDRRIEVAQIRQCQERLQSLAGSGKAVPRPAIENLVGRIDAFIERHPATPYRDGLLRVRALALRGGQGVLGARATEPVQPRLEVGKPAPEFATENLQTRETQTLRSWRGKPILLVFLQPGTELAPVIAKYAEQLAAEHDGLTVLACIMTEDRAALQNLVARTPLTISLLSGKALRQSYGVEATPRFVLIDADGITCSAYLGWGPEVTTGLPEDFKKCLAGTSVGKATPPR